MSFDVRIYAMSVRKDRPKPYSVRWKVGTKWHRKSFRTRGLADNYRSELMQAARRGESFEPMGGLPGSMMESVKATSWYDHAREYAEAKWSSAAGKTRASTADALATVTMALVRKSSAPKPDKELLRTVLVRHAFNFSPLKPPVTAEQDRILRWVEAHSVPLSDFEDMAEWATRTRAALNACATRMDGKPAAATTTSRKRAVLYNALGFAVENNALAANPLTKIQWKAPEAADEVDRRAVPSIQQARSLIAATSYVGRIRGERLMAFFALLYFAAMRPSEALALKSSDCMLPESGWGELVLKGSEPDVGKAWSDDGSRTEPRSLKWRSKSTIRVVPIPPELVAILRRHIDRFGVAAGGYLFATQTGGRYSPTAYNGLWTTAREYALAPTAVATPLAARPYDLRHGGVTLWLNSGVPAAEVARRAGHSTDVLLRIYAGCIDGESSTANARIDESLNDSQEADSSDEESRDGDSSDGDS